MLFMEPFASSVKTDWHITHKKMAKKLVISQNLWNFDVQTDYNTLPATPVLSTTIITNYTFI